MCSLIPRFLPSFLLPKSCIQGMRLFMCTLLLRCLYSGVLKIVGTSPAGPSIHYHVRVSFSLSYVSFLVSFVAPYSLSSARLIPVQGHSH